MDRAVDGVGAAVVVLVAMAAGGLAVAGVAVVAVGARNMGLVALPSVQVKAMDGGADGAEAAVVVVAMASGGVAVADGAVVAMAAEKLLDAAEAVARGVARGEGLSAAPRMNAGLAAAEEVRAMAAMGKVAGRAAAAMAATAVTAALAAAVEAAKVVRLARPARLLARWGSVPAQRLPIALLAMRHQVHSDDSRQMSTAQSRSHRSSPQAARDGVKATRRAIVAAVLALALVLMSIQAPQAGPLC